MNQPQKKLASRGRPKAFDRDAALERALNYFWQFGYDPTSMSDLTKATGAKAATLYAAFGSKEGLFCAAVERYLSVYGKQRDAILNQSSIPVENVIRQLLEMFVGCFTDPSTPAGCFVVSTAFGMSPDDDKLFQSLQVKRDENQKRLEAFLQRRIALGDLPGNMNVPLLANYAVNAVLGLSIQAKNGGKTATLMPVVDVFMQLWPNLVAVCQKS